MRRLSNALIVHYRTLLEDVVAAPSTPVAKLPLMDDDKRPSCRPSSHRSAAHVRGLVFRALLNWTVRSRVAIAGLRLETAGRSDH